MFQRTNLTTKATLSLLAVALIVSAGATLLADMGSVSPAEALSSSDTDDYLDILNDLHSMSRLSWSARYDYLCQNANLAWVDWS